MDGSDEAIKTKEDILFRFRRSGGPEEYVPGRIYEDTVNNIPVAQRFPCEEMNRRNSR